MGENDVVMDSATKNGLSKKLIIAVVAIVAIIAVVAGIIFAVRQTPEKAVKTFLKNYENKKASKVVEQMDLVGLTAWVECDGDYEDFSDKYDKYKEKFEDLDDDEYEEQVESMKEELEDKFEDIDKIKIEIKKIKSAKKVKDAKNLYKVNAKIKISITEDDDTNKSTSTVDFYVYKKSGKFYIIGMDTKSGNDLGLF